MIMILVQDEVKAKVDPGLPGSKGACCVRPLLVFTLDFDCTMGVWPSKSTSFYVFCKKNLKTVFHIEGGGESAEAQSLLLEIGPDYCSYAFLNRAAHAITGLKYFSIDEFETEAHLPSVFQELRDKSFSGVWICSAYPAALLTPLKYAGQDGALLHAIYDQPAQKHLSDTINEWQIVNDYSMPLAVYELLEKEFPRARFIHVYTPALRIYNGSAAGDQISIHFTLQHFRVLVKKEGQVYLAQIYSYKTPLDVVYYLLKICSELQLDQSGVHLILSGLVEETSALYKELRNYFLNLHFAPAPTVSVPQNEYPQHFFASTYNLAACVS